MELEVQQRDEIQFEFEEWKIQLGMQTKFICSKNSGETRTWHTRSDNIEI